MEQPHEPPDAGAYAILMDWAQAPDPSDPTGDPRRKPWERFDGEPEVEWACFESYLRSAYVDDHGQLDLSRSPRPRSMVDAMRAEAVDHATLLKAAMRWLWGPRATAYDRWLGRQRDRAVVDGMRDLVGAQRERWTRLSATLQTATERLAERVLEGGEVLTADQIGRLEGMLAKWVRLDGGSPTERVDGGASEFMGDIRNLNDGELALLGALHERLTGQSTSPLVPASWRPGRAI